jgi:hypothetical protein
MGTLLTGQQVNSALCPVNRAFFLLFYFYFLAGQFFLSKKSSPGSPEDHSVTRGFRTG